MTIVDKQKKLKKVISSSTIDDVNKKKLTNILKKKEISRSDLSLTLSESLFIKNSSTKNIDAQAHDKLSYDYSKSRFYSNCIDIVERNFTGVKDENKDK